MYGGAFALSTSLFFFFQARENKRFMDISAKEVSHLESAKDEMESFLSNQEELIAGFRDFKKDEFNAALRGERAAKKAAGKLLNSIGKRGAKKQPTEQTQEQQDRDDSDSLLKTLGKSAILEAAKKKECGVPTEGGPYRTKIIPEGKRLILPNCSRARRVKELRTSVLESQNMPPLSPSFPNSPGSTRTDDTQMTTTTLPQLRKKPSNATALTQWERGSKKARLPIRTSPMASQVLVVTGPVNYAKLLAQQQVMREHNERQYVQYGKMMTTYDNIQEVVQRKFSLFLKTNLLPVDEDEEGDEPISQTVSINEEPSPSSLPPLEC